MKGEVPVPEVRIRVSSTRDVSRGDRSQTMDVCLSRSGRNTVRPPTHLRGPRGVCGPRTTKVVTPKETEEIGRSRARHDFLSSDD